MTSMDYNTNPPIPLFDQKTKLQNVAVLKRGQYNSAGFLQPAGKNCVTPLNDLQCNQLHSY